MAQSYKMAQTKNVQVNYYQNWTEYILQHLYFIIIYFQKAEKGNTMKKKKEERKVGYESTKPDYV